MFATYTLEGSSQRFFTTGYIGENKSLHQVNGEIVDAMIAENNNSILNYTVDYKEGKSWNFSWLKGSDTIRLMLAQDEHRIFYVNNGLIRGTGIRTPEYHRCN
jgi:hypothetical protein